MNYKTVVWLSVLVTEKNKFACQRWKQPVLQSERFTYQVPWKISIFSTPQEGNTIPWRSLLLPSHSWAKLFKKKSVTIMCQQYKSASFLKTLQSGFTSGHRIEIVFIAAQPIITIEKSLILPYTAICRDLISQKYSIYKVEILHNGTCNVLFEAKLRMVDNSIFCPSLCSWGPRLYP